MDDVKTGNWYAYVKKIDEGYGERVASLLCFHEDIDMVSLRWHHVSSQIGVDSGRCGIFEFKHYSNDDGFLIVWYYTF